MAGKPYKDPDTLRRLYWEEGLSTHDIGDRFGVSGKTISRSMKDVGVDRRRPKTERPPHFVHATNHGYERVETQVDGELKHISIHRLIAVAECGVDTVAGNDIHHSNGVPWDNRPSNIEVIGHDDHRRKHTAERERDGDGKLLPKTSD